MCYWPESSQINDQRQREAVSLILSSFRRLCGARLLRGLPWRERRACWTVSWEKPRLCVFLRGLRVRRRYPALSCNGFLHQDSSKIATTALAPACLTSIHTQMLAWRLPSPNAPPLLPRRSLAHARAEVTTGRRQQRWGRGWERLVGHDQSPLKQKVQKFQPTILWRGRETSFPGPALCSRRVPSSRATRWGLSTPRQEPLPGTPLLPGRLAGFIGQARAARLPRRTCASPGRTRPSPGTTRSARFSLSQQAGKACAPRRAERAGGPGAGPRRKPELPATCSARRGGESASELPRRQPSEFCEKPPLENTKTFQKTRLCPSRPAAFHPSVPLVSSRPGPHLRPCPGLRHVSSPPPPLFKLLLLPDLSEASARVARVLQRK